MTAKEFLSQAYRLEQRIKVLTNELVHLREMAQSISSPAFSEHYNASRNTDAPFMKMLDKVHEREAVVSERIKDLLEIREKIDAAISTLPDEDYKLILIYRYLSNKSWFGIGREMHINESTVRRWHDKALEQIKIPKE